MKMKTRILDSNGAPIRNAIAGEILNCWDTTVSKEAIPQEYINGQHVISFGTETWGLLRCYKRNAIPPTTNDGFLDIADESLLWSVTADGRPLVLIVFSQDGVFGALVPCFRERSLPENVLLGPLSRIIGRIDRSNCINLSLPFFSVHVFYETISPWSLLVAESGRAVNNFEFWLPEGSYTIKATHIINGHVVTDATSVNVLPVPKAIQIQLSPKGAGPTNGGLRGTHEK